MIILEDYIFTGSFAEFPRIQSYRLENLPLRLLNSEGMTALLCSNSLNFDLGVTIRDYLSITFHERLNGRVVAVINSHVRVKGVARVKARGIWRTV